MVYSSISESIYLSCGWVEIGADTGAGDRSKGSSTSFLIASNKSADLPLRPSFIPFALAAVGAGELMY
jgi:hypothetical protein